MRVICDHCSLPIAGTVKRLAGNLNLHPQCLAEPQKEAKRESATFRAALYPGQELYKPNTVPLQRPNVA